MFKYAKSHRFVCPINGWILRQKSTANSKKQRICCIWLNSNACERQWCGWKNNTECECNYNFINSIEAIKLMMTFSVFSRMPKESCHRRHRRSMTFWRWTKRASHIIPMEPKLITMVLCGECLVTNIVTILPMIIREEWKADSSMFIRQIFILYIRCSGTAQEYGGSPGHSTRAC